MAIKNRTIRETGALQDWNREAVAAGGLATDENQGMVAAQLATSHALIAIYEVLDRLVAAHGKPIDVRTVTERKAEEQAEYEHEVRIRESEEREGRL
jgi:hypothetical protein